METSSWAASEAIRRTMLGNGPRDTEPELRLRRLLHRRGLRYRVATRPIKGVRRTADLVFGPAKVAVFVDGCFWHVCPEHSTTPRTNQEYWLPKLQRNVQRDRETDALLRDAGWVSIRVWEHENPKEAADRIEETVRKRRREITNRDRPPGGP